MAQIKRFVTIGGTLAAAIAIGVIMQNGASGKEEISEFESPVAIDVEESARLRLTNIVNTSALPNPPSDIQEIAVLPTIPVLKVAAPETTFVAPKSGLASPALSCEITFEAYPLAAAMVDLTLNAPCLPNERATLHHNGMMFSVATDATGGFSLQVPALAQTAVFIVAFANGEGAVVTSQAPSLEFYDRVVVQWRGASGLQLHAREYGAQYGDSGHVWAQSAREITFAARGQGGVITRHGDESMAEALVAEVYTFPTGTAQSDGEILMSVEAEITASNCGREIEAQTLQVTANARLKVQELTLAVPDCDAIGDFLVLNNMLNDLTIARN
ncbi:MAG: hypothetical protein Q9M48_12350 [Rhodobacterales bacterium]|nr:hypothetical protein [Rhodobacterales bacterium]